MQAEAFGCHYTSVWNAYGCQFLKINQALFYSTPVVL